MIHTFDVYSSHLQENLHTYTHTHRTTQNIAYTTHYCNLIALIKYNYRPHEQFFLLTNIRHSFSL